MSSGEKNLSFMNNVPSPESATVEVRNLPEGIELEFPRRSLGALRFLGLFLVGFGLVFSGFAVHWIRGAIGFSSHDDSSFNAAKLIFALFGVPFFVAGMVPIGMGFFILFGHTVIEWGNGVLKTTERAGPFWWTQKRKTAGLERLLVALSSDKMQGARPAKSQSSTLNLATLTAEFSDAKPLPLAVGYPPEWLQLAANHLAARSATPFQTTALPQRIPKVETVQAGAMTLENDTVEAQPPDSKIRCEQGNGRQLFVIPPAGLIKGSKGLFVFSVIWCGFIGVIAGFALFGNHDKSEFWIPTLFFLVFLAVGVGMMLGAIQMGRRRAMLSAGRDGVSIVVAGIFGIKRWDWTEGQVAFIRTGPSGMEVNNQPVIELQIHPANGKKKGFLAGRNVDELKWLATRLRQELAVAAFAPEEKH
jgi:hypothetical protein